MIEERWNFSRTISYNNQSFNDFLSYKDKCHRLTRGIFGVSKTDL